LIDMGRATVPNLITDEPDPFGNDRKSVFPIDRRQ
jgi:hypothetical protein